MNGSKLTVPEWGDIGADVNSPAYLENSRVIREELPKGQPSHSTQQAWRKPEAAKPVKPPMRQESAKGLPEEAELQAARKVDGEEEIPSGMIVETAESFLKSYVVLPAALPLPVTLWAIGTYFTLLFDAYGYLALTSPTPRCGKTRLQEILEMIAWRPRKATCMSESSLFRMLEKSPGYPAPTLLLDEAESLKKAKDSRADALNSILNSGYRDGQKVPRVVPEGKGFKVEWFDTYGPKCIATIGNLPPTLQDRSLVVEMQRRAPNEPVERFLFGQARKESAILRNSLRRDMSERAPEVVKAYQSINDLPFLGDRDAEIAIPLFAICRVFAPSREAELKTTLVRVFGEKASQSQDDSLGVRLLADIRVCWPEGKDAVQSTDLLGALRGLPDSPWAGGVELNVRKLAWRLHGFNCRPRPVRIDSQVVKGYIREELERAWASYLSPIEADTSVTGLQPALIAPANDAPCNRVTDTSPLQRERERDFPPDIETESEV